MFDDHHFDFLWKEFHARLTAGSLLNNTGNDPIFYLIYPPEQVLQARENLEIWLHRLHNEGFRTKTYSVAEALKRLWKANEFRDLWMESELDGDYEPDALRQVNEQLSESTFGNDALLDDFRAHLDDFTQELGEQRGVFWVCDLEALHPYGRIGALEQRLQGQVAVPTVFLYPGQREGNSTLKFLGFYPADGNYRAVMIG